MIAVIDNYDSFTYNIVQVISRLSGEQVAVFRSRECTLQDIENVHPSGLIVSPGPGNPADAGISVDAIRRYAGKIPILGICLGHQAIAYAFGADIVGAKRIRHGSAEKIALDGKGLFRSIGTERTFTRYHSLAVDEKTLPADFEITARSDDGDIMGIRHKTYVLEGVQFHPESIASDGCDAFFTSFLNYRRENLPAAAILGTLANGKNLTQEAAELFMEDLTDGFQDPRQTAAILSALAVKGPSAAEIAGCAAVLCRKKKTLPLAGGVELTDIVGTGGDGKGSFNISSFAALIAAACGLPVAKHGNRAVSSKSGSADFYESLGIKIDNLPEKTAAVIEQSNFGFLYAPVYHRAMRHAAPVRKSLGIKTIMNLIGPLSNPAGARCQMLGVYDESLLDPVAEASKLLGSKRVMTVCSEDGFDELSPCAPTHVTEIDEDGVKRSYTVVPEEFGISGCTPDGLAGGTGAENARIALDLLAAPETSARTTVAEACCLNAGAALYIGGRSASIRDGYAQAKAALKNGLVAQKLAQVRELSNA